MKKIKWIRIGSKKYGGFLYGEKVRSFLSEHYETELKIIEARVFRNLKYLKSLEWFVGLKMIRGQTDLWVRDDFFSIAISSLNKVRGKELAIIHHIDFSVFPFFLRPLIFIVERFFYHNLKKMAAIVVVSEFWRDYFQRIGYKNIYKIYSGFNVSEFNISEQEVLEFKKKFGLAEKPIIYLGNCQKAKGVVESYEALKDLDVCLVTSGDPMVKLPVINLALGRRDYLKLLKSSSVVLTMSKFLEGWCITAHEAMLCKTPVIGSGFGGMEELLSGGQQIICKDFSQLREKVDCLLLHPELRTEMGENGYKYAKDFTLEKFKEEWLNLIKKLLNEK